MINNSDRVDRGGSWNVDAPYARVAYRSRFDPGSRRDFLGFRLVLATSPFQRIGEANVDTRA